MRVSEHWNRNPHGAARIEHHPAFGEIPGGDEVLIVFDGSQVAAREGESLLAALLAAGIRVLRTMPLTGEARGGYCVAGRCSDCLVIVDGVPNIQACTTMVCAGMVVETQHGLGHWPEGAS
jgi:predicted molibdopterin-dependent oxidoreductase YjgC